MDTNTVTQAAQIISTAALAKLGAGLAVGLGTLGSGVGIGVIFGVAVLYSVIMIAWYGIKLQAAGGDPLKSQEAKHGLKATIVGIGITFSAIFIIGLILYVLGLIGVKGN